MAATATRGQIVPSVQSESTSSFLESMQHLLVGGGPADEDIVLPGRLDRSRLDFSLESLEVIDQYLNDVHDNDQTVVGLSLLTTIWATALYVGEIIRRAAPARYFQWVTITDELPASGGTTTSQFDLGAVRALRAHDGEMCLPSRAVLRVILRGRKARSVHSFARGAIEASTWVQNPLHTAELAAAASAP
jgi:hypothetical protein